MGRQHVARQDVARQDAVKSVARSTLMSGRMGLALASAILVMAAVLLPGRAEAQFGLRGGPVGVARFAVGHMFGLSRLRHSRMAVRGGRYRSAALRARDPRGADRSQLSNPYVLRAALTAQAALAGWQGGRRAQGWWRHPDGSYGWVGPVFWPFAHDDLTNAIIFGDTTSLSLYGYGDLYAALFTPYAAAELAAYTEPRGRRARKVPAAETLCEASDTGGLPVERIASAVAPNEAQRTALDELSSAWLAAHDTIRDACPAQTPANAAERLGLMRERVAAMIKAIDAVEAPLSTFVGLLNDDQKARLNALAHERRAALASYQSRNGVKNGVKSADRNAIKDGPKDGPRDGPKDEPKHAQGARACQADYDPLSDENAQRQYEQLVQQQWPAAEIAATLHLDDVARARFEVLQDTTLRTMQTLSACPTEPAATPQARLAAVKTRLQTMLQSVGAVSDAFDDFQADLSDEQKAAFEAIGPKRRA